MDAFAQSIKSAKLKNQKLGLLEGARAIDPPWLAGKLASDAQQLMSSGDNARAAEYLELALKLAPNSQLRSMLAKADAGSLEQLRAKAATNLQDFDTRLRIDHVLAEQKRWPEIIQVWDAVPPAQPR